MNIISLVSNERKQTLFRKKKKIRQSRLWNFEQSPSSVLGGDLNGNSIRRKVRKLRFEYYKALLVSIL